MAFPLMALAAVPAIFQGITGLIQNRRGREGLANLERPEYKIPDDINAMLTMAAQRYSDPYTTGEVNAMRNIGLSGANALQAGRDSGNIGGIVPAVAAQQSAAYNRLAEQVDANKERQQAALTDMLGVRAKYKDQEWQMNQFAPYSDKYQEFRQMVGGGEQNIFGALNNLSGIGMMLGQSRSIAPSAAAGATSAITNQGANIQDLISKYANMARQESGNLGWGIDTIARNFPY